jgi:hypothetical protein
MSRSFGEIPLLSNIVDYRNIGADVKFQLSKGGDITNVGTQGASTSIRTQRDVFSSFDITIERPELTITQYLTALGDSFLEGNAALFDDFSDNYVFDWEDGEISQYGLLVPIKNTLSGNLYQMVKVYKAGGYKGYRVIQSIPLTADLTTNIPPANLVNIDRTTGVVEATGVRGIFKFQTDAYLIKVRISATPAAEIRNNRNTDLEFANFVYDPNEIVKPKSNMRLTLQLREINDLKDLALFATEPFIGDGALTYLPWHGYIRDSQISPIRQAGVYSHKDVVTSSYRPTTPVNTASKTITLPSGAVKHKNLIYWLTLYRATAGTHFEYTP